MSNKNPEPAERRTVAHEEGETRSVGDVVEIISAATGLAALGLQAKQVFEGKNSEPPPPAQPEQQPPPPAEPQPGKASE
jgi:hypothetical protein